MKPADVGYRLRRTVLAVAALFAFGTAIVGTTAAIEGHADAGVVIDSSGVVASVSRSGFSWRDGIRPGQTVVSATRADAVDGWSIVTLGPSGRLSSREAPIVDALRGALPFALVGLAAGCLALVFLRSNREWVLPAICVALIGSSIPLFLTNQAMAAPTLALAATVPSVWVTWRIRRRRFAASALGISISVILLVWLLGYLNGDGADTIDQLRRTVALGGTGLLMADRAMQDRSERTMTVTPQRALWILTGAVCIATGLALMYFAAIPAPLVAIAIVLGLLAIRPLRSMIGRRLELALMADLREHVAADVAEEERGRLARELHDAPLQELSAVIRRLELVPGASAETKSLQDIANDLRSVAIDLRPPMLDDLGLGAALDFLAEQSTSSEVGVWIRVRDETGLEPSMRPPATVEFALYRIAREAVTNALRHADATSVVITGDIGIASIDLKVSDDGVGVSRDVSRRASGRGRLGLASMRRRAQAIGAELSIEGSSAGTRVTVAWRL